MAKIPPYRVACCHCGTQIRACGCHLHPPPMWWHWPARFHRCGEGGDAATFAEPAKAA